MAERRQNIIKLTTESLAWYFRRSDKQYSDTHLRLYDQAAELLTSRLEFAEFLVSKLGINPGKILEIAAGSGLVSSVLKNKLDNAIFIDLSLQALDMLKRRKEFNN